MRILLVEDDEALAEAVEQHLKRATYQVDVTHNGKIGYELAIGHGYDLIILDIMLPGMNGIDVLKSLRSASVKTPVLMLTAKGSVRNRVTGLDSGADDYLPKPFASEELIARVNALGRRRERQMNEPQTNIGDLVLNSGNLTLSRADISVVLTGKEFELFQYLSEKAGILSSKDQIIEKIWGYDGEAEGNNVEVYISMLRKKLKYLQSSVSIKTVRYVGYSMEVS